MSQELHPVLQDIRKQGVPIVIAIGMFFAGWNFSIVRADDLDGIKKTYVTKEEFIAAMTRIERGAEKVQYSLDNLSNQLNRTNVNLEVLKTKSEVFNANLAR